MCSQLTALSASTCKQLHSIGPFSSCSMSTKIVSFHSAVRSRESLTELGVWLPEKYQAENCPCLWLPVSPLNRFSNQCVTSYTLSTSKHCSISVTKQSARPLALFFHHFSSCTERTLLIVIRTRLPWRAAKLSPRLLWKQILSACTSHVSVLSTFHNGL